MLNEIIRKRNIWNMKKGNCDFRVDSLQDDILNIDFLAIDHPLRRNIVTHEDIMINRLMSGEKIQLGGF